MKFKLLVELCNMISLKTMVLQTRLQPLLFLTLLLLFDTAPSMHITPNSIHLAPQSVQPQFAQMHGLETVIDLRGDGPYKFREKNNLIGTVTMNSTMEIQFDLRLGFVNKNTSSSRNIPILFIEGRTTVNLILYLNEKGRFGIMHYHRTSSDWKCLIETSIFLLSESRNSFFLPVQHVKIQITSRDKIVIAVNGNVVTKAINRELCPEGEVMNVWLDGTGFKAKASVAELVIRAQYVFVENREDEYDTDSLF